MERQLHKRLPREFVEEILEAFNGRRLTEERVCELLGIKRVRFYRLRRQWLRDARKRQGFSLWNRKESRFHTFPEEMEDWLPQGLTCRFHLDFFTILYNISYMGDEASRI